MKKILFVSNEAARTGAPAILLGLMQWLKRHDDVETVCVLMRDGALRGDFEQIGRTYTWAPKDLNQPQRIHKRLANALYRGDTDPGAWLSGIIDKEAPTTIYLSTLVLGKYLGGVAKTANRRIITHVHELLPSLRQLSSDQLVKRQLHLSDAVISCAECVASTLASTYELPSEKSVIIPEYINIDSAADSTAQSMSPATLPADERAAIAKLQDAIERGIPIFGIGGNPINRKGFDLFPLLVKNCQDLFGDSPFLAVWIGCNEGSQAHAAMEWDLALMGLTDRVALIPSVSLLTFRWIVSQFRVLTLLSREDPFPLVVLEASRLGVPTVCFADSGAIPAMAEQGQCLKVAYLDIPAFAAAVHQLCQRNDLARSIADRCRQKVERDLSLAAVAPRVAAVMFPAEGS